MNVHLEEAQVAMSRVTRSGVTLVVVALLFLVGEIPAMAGIRGLVIPLATWLMPWPGAALYVAELLLAFVLIFAVGCILGRASVAFNKEATPAKTRLGAWLDTRRKGFVRRLLAHGEPLGFVLASYLGGAALVGWWYARKADPNAFRKAVGAAAVLGAFSSALWVTAFNPTYYWVGIVVAVGMPVLAIPVAWVARLRRQPQHAAR